MPESESQNRRQFFRVQDRLGLEYQLLAPGCDVHDLFGDQITLGLHQELDRIDQEIRQQLATLAERDRNLAYMLKTMNQKLDTLARIMAFEQKPLQPQQWHSVTLSEGGLAFVPDNDPLALGDRLALRLTLLPELQQIAVAGEVVENTPEETPGQVHVAFTGLTDSDRQTLARHVLRVQARERQAKQPSNL